MLATSRASAVFSQISFELHGGFSWQSGVLPVKPAIMPQYSFGASHPRGQRESGCYAQLKHRHPLSIAHKITWGLFVHCNKEFERTLVICYQARLGSLVYSPKTPG